jgi:hypothetical protein
MGGGVGKGNWSLCEGGLEGIGGKDARYTAAIDGLM